MIINDEPSPVKRLYAEAQKKMSQTSLHKKLSSFSKRNVYMILGGLFVVAVMNGFYFADFVSSKSTKKTADETVQLYNACVLSKGLLGQTQSGEISLDITYDEECLRLSSEGKITQSKQDILAGEIEQILEGTPMQQMAPLIAQKDKKVAALIVGIANIESQMGRRSPWKNGQDCYNYWGYKTSGSRGQALGHACFGSPEEAVDTIAKRLEHFVYDTGRETPAQMVYPWKCGGSCASHSPESVSRWIGTVNKYYSQIIALDYNEDAEQRNKKSKFLSKK